MLVRSVAEVNRAEYRPRVFRHLQALVEIRGVDRRCLGSGYPGESDRLAGRQRLPRLPLPVLQQNLTGNLC